MSRYREENTESKVYVGDLPRDADEKDLERVFGHYGPLKSVWVARNPPGFAFLEFEDARDAEDAVRGLDGTNICGARARVEHATGKVRPKPWQRDGGGGGDRGGSSRYGGGGSAPPARRGGNFDPSDRCFGCGERGHYSYDCPKNARGGGGGSRRKRSPSRSRSRSREPARRRSYSRSPSRNRDRSRDRSPKRSVSRD